MKVECKAMKVANFNLHAVKLMNTGVGQFMKVMMVEGVVPGVYVRMI